MNVRKFIAKTARDGLYKVKEVLGDDAIILSNRTIYGGVEIMAVAAHDMEMITPPPPARKESSQHKEPVIKEPVMNEALLSRIASAPGSQEGSDNAFSLMSGAVVEDPYLLSRERHAYLEPFGAAHSAPGIAPAEIMEEIRSLHKEIRSLHRVIEQHLAGLAWGDMTRSEPVKTDVLRQMLDVGFSPKFSREMLVQLPQGFDISQALGWVKKRIERALLTIDANNDIVDKGGVFALVGPTGVGKTTVIAKLAARCVLRHGANKVALVTTDGYRIGALEHMRSYGRILGVPVQLARDTGELKQTLLDLQHKHMILIDTMGASQRDKVVKGQSAMFKECNVQRLLLLAATGRGDTLDDAAEAYGGDNLAGCILTKVDEAISVATPLDVIIRHGLRVYYVSNGQSVPEDFHLPNRAYLMHRSFKGLPETSAHRLEGLEPGLIMSNASANLIAAGENLD